MKICKRREEQQAKQAVRLGLKSEWSGQDALTSSCVNVAPPAYRVDLSYP